MTPAVLTQAFDKLLIFTGLELYAFDLDAVDEVRIVFFLCPLIQQLYSRIDAVAVG